LVGGVWYTGKQIKPLLIMVGACLLVEYLNQVWKVLW
jgi:hypothetical protein